MTLKKKLLEITLNGGDPSVFVIEVDNIASLEIKDKFVFIYRKGDRVLDILYDTIAEAQASYDELKEFMCVRKLEAIVGAFDELTVQD